MKNEKVIPIKKASIGLKCGDCLCFKRVVNPKYPKICKDLGVKAQKDAPACYTPDPHKVLSAGPETMRQLALLMQQFDASGTRVLMALLKQQNALIKKYGVKFGQPVFFRLGKDYLSNYFRGFVVGCDAFEDAVYITSTLGEQQKRSPFILSLGRGSVLTNVEFKKAREELEERKRLNDPSPLFSPTPEVKSASDYTPPSMEDAPKEWFDKIEMEQATKKGKKKSPSGQKIVGITGELSFKV